ncbi:MAG: glycosyltransferase family 4 protein [Ferruginibacter sp.]
MEKKNIILVENHIISANTVRRKFTTALMEYGYNVTILSAGSKQELNKAREKGFQVIDIGTSNTNPADIARYIYNIRKALLELKPDVCCTFTMRPAIWGNMVTRSLGIPTITNITGIGPLAESKSLAYAVARTLYKYVLRKTRKVFFQNRDDMKIFIDKKFIRPEVVGLLPGSGVDYEYFQPREKQSSSEIFKFLFISRLIKDKGIIEYVEAASILREKYNHVEFQVLGPYYSQNLKENIITEKDIVGWVEQGIIKYLGAADDVRPFIAEADCIVLPSYREGMSGVLLESGSMERPCITTNVTGCRDVIEDGVNGFLCEVKNSQDLADKMEKMLQLPESERKRLGTNARKITVKKFAKQLVIDAYINAIEEIHPPAAV